MHAPCMHHAGATCSAAPSATAHHCPQTLRKRALRATHAAHFLAQDQAQAAAAQLLSTGALHPSTGTLTRSRPSTTLHRRMRCSCAPRGHHVLQLRTYRAPCAAAAHLEGTMCCSCAPTGHRVLQLRTYRAPCARRPSAQDSACRGHPPCRSRGCMWAPPRWRTGWPAAGTTPRCPSSWRIRARAPQRCRAPEAGRGAGRQGLSIGYGCMCLCVAVAAGRCRQPGWSSWWTAINLAAMAIGMQHC
jgi:hypothetical protein